MKLTLFGARALVFYGVMWMAFFGAPYVNLFFLLIGFLSVQWVLALIWTWRNATGIEARFPALAPIASGGSARIVATLAATHRTRFDVSLVLVLGSGQKASGRVQVLRKPSPVVLTTPALARGIYPLHRAYVTSTFPFGLLRKQTAVESPCELVVYPSPLASASQGRTADDLFRELLGTSLSGQGDLQPSSLRDHRQGDGLRTVHWRASARRGKLVVQEWDGGSAQGMEVVLDRRASTEELEAALSELSTLVQLARESKQVLAIRTQGLNDTFGEGHTDWEQALRFLAATERLSEQDLAPPSAAPEVLRLPRRLARA